MSKLIAAILKENERLAIKEYDADVAFLNAYKNDKYFIKGRVVSYRLHMFDYYRNNCNIKASVTRNTVDIVEKLMRYEGVDCEVKLEGFITSSPNSDNKTVYLAVHIYTK